MKYNLVPEDWCSCYRHEWLPSTLGSASVGKKGGGKSGKGKGGASGGGAASSRLTAEGWRKAVRLAACGEINGLSVLKDSPACWEEEDDGLRLQEPTLKRGDA